MSFIGLGLDGLNEKIGEEFTIGKGLPAVEV